MTGVKAENYNGIANSTLGLGFSSRLSSSKGGME